MDGLVKTTEKKEVEEEFSFKEFFIPLTTLKVIHWIVIIGFIVFFNTLFNGFVWDDITQIVNNNYLHSLANLPIFFTSNSILNASFYRPIQLSYIAFLYTMFNGNPFFLHLLQVVIHITNAILVFYLFRKVINRELSLFLSLVFLVHPITVESVSYISASSEILYTFFGLLALNLAQIKERKLSRTLIIYLLLLFSVLSKESGFLFIFLLLLYQLLTKSSTLKVDIFFSSGVATFYLFLRIFVAHIYYPSLPFIPIVAASTSIRFITMPKIALYYLKTFLFPKDLAISQQWLVSSPTLFNFYIPLVLLLLLLSVLIYISIWIHRYKKTYFPSFTFFCLWFLVGLGICLQIIPLTMTVADRWFYASMIGVLGVTGIVIQAKQVKNRLIKHVFVIFAIAVIVALSIRTVIRNSNWHDPFTLYSQDEAISKSYFLESDLGLEYMSRAQYDQARLYLQKSVNQYPYEINLYNLGLTYAKQNNTKKARYYFNQAVKHYKGEVYYTTLAKLLFTYNDPEDAKTLIENGLAKKPNDMLLLIYLGLSDYKMGNKKAALETAQKVYSLYPNAQTQYMLDHITNNLPLELR